MYRFKHYISAGCIAFTFSSIFYLLFSLLHIFPPMDAKIVVNMLLISIGIIYLVFLTHLFPIRNPLLLRLLELFDVVIVILGVGLVFNMFPFNWSTISFVVAIGLLTYIIVISFTFMGNQSSAVQINAVISREKRSDSNE
ncbi:hypothetical protein FQ087_06450 [Sporosarcina sp. ANT_H38]|uniref:hypothetical protein n=1 Tax=Sporosarcina sp. ANT_H38 TaxID=2597358 RepID=UPI0011F14A9E|nr:hypothetical protein [Sporosarcina sp. ANT_H38]KAA0965900.1 hypothetical protein FQ087_06450 [Sporosarcina sp. ANT_H38]